MRANVNITKVIAVPTDRVWEAVAGIAGLDRWFPVIASCEVEGAGVGAVRRMGIEGGGLIVDQIDLIDHAERRFRYVRTESPFPVSSYVGTVEVTEAGDKGTEVSWTIEIEVAPEDRQGVSDFVYGAISDGISGMEVDLQ